eukprot:scaffold31385_cov146-Isochrysis_galbana.AAC.1
MPFLCVPPTVRAAPQCARLSLRERKRRTNGRIEEGGRGKARSVLPGDTDKGRCARVNGRVIPISSNLSTPYRPRAAPQNTPSSLCHPTARTYYRPAMPIIHSTPTVHPQYTDGTIAKHTRHNSKTTRTRRAGAAPALALVRQRVHRADELDDVGDDNAAFVEGLFGNGAEEEAELQRQRLRKTILATGQHGAAELRVGPDGRLPGRATVTEAAARRRVRV